jgi:hypothetical protein
MHNPRSGLGGDVAVGRIGSPVGSANCGKNSAPAGVVLYRRPLGEVKMIVPSGS